MLTNLETLIAQFFPSSRTSTMENDCRSSISGIQITFLVDYEAQKSECGTLTVNVNLVRMDDFDRAVVPIWHKNDQPLLYSPGFFPSQLRFCYAGAHNDIKHKLIKRHHHLCKHCSLCILIPIKYLSESHRSVSPAAMAQNSDEVDRLLRAVMPQAPEVLHHVFALEGKSLRSFKSRAKPDKKPRGERSPAGAKHGREQSCIPSPDHCRRTVQG